MSTFTGHYCLQLITAQHYSWMLLHCWVFCRIFILLFWHYVFLYEFIGLNIFCFGQQTLQVFSKWCRDVIIWCIDNSWHFNNLANPLFHRKSSKACKICIVQVPALHNNIIIFTKIQYFPVNTFWNLFIPEQISHKNRLQMWNV